MTFLYLFLSDLWNPIYSLLVRFLPFTAFLLKTLLERTWHNKPHLSHCHNLCLALWPLYLKPFDSLQVVMWDKGGHFLVTDWWGRPRQGSLVSPRFTVNVCWDFPLCPVSPLKELLWFEGQVKYEDCQVPRLPKWVMKGCCTLAELGDSDARDHYHLYLL